MRKQGLLTMAAWATGTCAVALAMLLPGSLQADSATPAVVQPVLHLQGAELTVRLDNADADAAAGVVRVTKDSSPTLLLVARNPTDKTIAIHPMVDLLTTSPASPLSRTPNLSRSIWRKECTITLAPGAEQTVRLKPDTLLPAGNMFTVQLGSAETAPAKMTLNALTFTVPKELLATPAPAGLF